MTGWDQEYDIADAPADADQMTWWETSLLLLIGALLCAVLIIGCQGLNGAPRQPDRAPVGSVAPTVYAPRGEP